MRTVKKMNGKHLLLVGAILTLFLLHIQPAKAQLAYIVNSTGDESDFDFNDGVCDGDADTPGAQCTLRAAIQNANNIPGHDVIEFASGITSIPVNGVLPDITDSLTIDGTTNGGYVELDGTNSSGGSTIFDPIGLDIHAGDSIVRGMVINRFGSAIRIVNGGSNLIQNNRIGTDISGSVTLENVQGMYIFSDNNMVDGNLISGNERVGININGSSAFNNHIVGNIIGLDISGAVALGNGGAGVRVSDADSNFIGGAVPGAGNTISGNDDEGVLIVAANATADGNVVQGNLIGINTAGTAVIGNTLDGIEASSTTNTLIGGAAGGRNVVSGNGGHGVYIHAGSGATVQNNYIGTDKTGTIALGNIGDGVNLTSLGSGTIVGGSGLGNLIAGNGGDGIDIGNAALVVQDNIIGLDATGTAVLGNAGHGIRMSTQSDDTVIGGPGLGNVISGNSGHGIYIGGAINNPMGIKIFGNFIGTDGAGTALLGNLGDGVHLIEGDDNEIGGTAAGEGNLIGGNSGNGVVIDGVNASGNKLEGNTIGTNAAGALDLGNGNNGVLIDSSNTTVGGTTSGAANTIAFNGADGVSVTNGTKVYFQENSIFANGGLGIDLADDGVTLNDLNDSDGGPNRRQNFPVLTAVTNDISTTITGILFSENNNDSLIEFFANSSCDPSEHGEGETYLGSLPFTTGTGATDFSITLPVAVPDGHWVTATVTDIGGFTFGTSEFSRCLAVPTLSTNDIFWNNPAGGDWNDPNNWLPARVPEVDHDVFITLDGTYEVTMSVNSTVNSLTLGGNSGSQTLVMNGRTLTINADSMVHENGILHQDNGILKGVGNLVIDGQYLWEDGTREGPGATTISAGATLTLASINLKDLTGQTMTNDGTVLMIGTGTLRFRSGSGLSAIFNNNGLFDARVDGLLDFSSGAGTAFNNNGTFLKSAGAGTTTVDVLFNNSGLVEAQSGTISFTRGFNQNGGQLQISGGEFTFAQSLNLLSGVLGGNGVVNGDVVNDAAIAPGFSPGQLTINGTYEQTGAGNLDIEMGGMTAGSEYDRLDIGGQATLTGTLNISLINGFSPASGSSYLIMTFASRVGTFATVTGLDLGDGRAFQLLYDATGVHLLVPPNSPPLANDDAIVTDEDTSITIDVLANDSDGDGDVISVGAITQPSSGSTVLNPDNSVTYIPDPDYNVLDGGDSFSYTINDGHGEADTATVSITVNPVNDAPVAEDDNVTTAEDTVVSIAVLANDSDVDGDALTVDSFSSPANGTVVLNSDQSVTYTPFASFNGSDSFSYSLSDGNGGLATAAVIVQVAPENDSPEAVNDTASTPEDTAVTIPVLANDNDIDGDTLSIIALTSVNNGVAILNPDKTVTYTPNPDYHGADSFEYTVSDGNGGTDSALVTIAINPVNDAPVATADSATTLEDTAVSLDILANDTDVDGDALTVASVTSPDHGQVTINSDNSLTFTPTPDFNGSDRFSVSIKDPQGAMDTAEVLITITAVNDTPIASSDSTVTPEDTAVTIRVLDNDSDVDGDSLSVTAVSSAANGSVSINGDNTVTYTPSASFNGLDSFSYTVNDGNGGSDSANVTITVSAENDNPVAQDDSGTTAEDTAITLSVLANDSDIDGDALMIETVSQAENGTVQHDGLTLTYAPNGDFNGSDSFSYTITDGQGGSDTAVVSIEVTAVNDAPEALDDSATVSEGAMVSISVLSNDSDIDGDSLTINSVGAPINGAAVSNPDGTITYTPAAGFSGLDSFQYTVSDGNGGTDTATVTVNVTPVAADCNLYPIALHAASLNGIAVGETVSDILNGAGSGHFGWLSWTGDNDVNTLVASLTPPGNSHTYINPNDTSDHTVSVGDWIFGKPGVSNAKSVRDALDHLQSVELIVPVWEQSQGEGANTQIQLTAYAKVSLLDYQLAGEDSITVQFLGYQSCNGS